MFPFALQPLCRHRITPPSPTPLAHPSILSLPPPFYVPRARFIEVSSWLLFVFVVNDVLSNKNALAYVYHRSHHHNHHHLMPSPSLAPTTLPSLFWVITQSEWCWLLFIYFSLDCVQSNDNYLPMLLTAAAPAVTTSHRHLHQLASTSNKKHNNQKASSPLFFELQLLLLSRHHPTIVTEGNSNHVFPFLVPWS